MMSMLAADTRQDSGKAMWLDRNRGLVSLADAFQRETRRPQLPLPIDKRTNGPAATVAGDVVSDDAIMQRVQAGDVQALSILFERHQAPLLNFYLRLTGNRANSEDLVQDVFVRILKYRATYRPGSRFVTWMYYIARNARLDYARKRRGEVEWDEGYAPSFEPPDALQASQQERLLALALQRLPEDKREVLVLSRFQGLKYDEIASLLGCEVGTIKVRVHRAIRELREHFHRVSQGSIA